MNIFPFEEWSVDELKAAQKVLFDVATNQKTDREGGDFSECAPWVVKFAAEFFDKLLSDEPEKEVQRKIFQARTDNDRRIRREIEVMKFNLSQRIDWLAGDNRPALIERFGRLSTVPEWVCRAALKSAEQHFHNLKGAQRSRTEKPEKAAAQQLDAQEEALKKITEISNQGEQHG